jgi:hypothetical protein
MDFTHAFIYVLSGGNEGLIKLGLRGWIARAFDTPGVNSPRPFGRLRAGLFLGGGVTTFEDLSKCSSHSFLLLPLADPGA